MGQPAPGYFAPPPPPPPKAKFKMPGWAIALIVVGTFVVLACFGGVAAFVYRGVRAANDAVTSASDAQRGLGNLPDYPTTPPTASPVPLVPTGPAPPDKSYEGRGNKTIDIDLNEDWLHVAKITHKGTSNFMVDSLDASGQPIDLVVNEVGNYTGVRLLDGDRGVPSRLKIRADGSWRVTVMVATKAPRWTGRASGTGDAILQVDPADPAVTVRFTHKGRSNTTLQTRGEKADLLVNEIGRYAGQMQIPTGTTFIDITGDGSWILEKV